MRKYTYLHFKLFFFYLLCKICGLLCTILSLLYKKEHCIAVLLCKHFGRNRSLVVYIIKHVLLILLAILNNFFMKSKTTKQWHTFDSNVIFLIFVFRIFFLWSIREGVSCRVVSGCFSVEICFFFEVCAVSFETFIILIIIIIITTAFDILTIYF